VLKKLFPLTPAMPASGAFVNTAWDAIILDSHQFSDNRGWNPSGIEGFSGNSRNLFLNSAKRP
jgi:hypothetical protein